MTDPTRYYGGVEPMGDYDQLVAKIDEQAARIAFLDAANEAGEANYQTIKALLKEVGDVLAYFVCNFPAGTTKDELFEDMFSRGMKLIGILPFTADTDSDHAPGGLEPLSARSGADTRPKTE